MLKMFTVATTYLTARFVHIDGQPEKTHFLPAHRCRNKFTRSSDCLFLVVFFIANNYGNTPRKTKKLFHFKNGRQESRRIIGTVLTIYDYIT